MPHVRSTRSAFLLATLLPLVALPAAAARASAPPVAAARADSLHRTALANLARNTIDARRMALADLDAASRLTPDSVEVWRDFARACQATDMRARARLCLERVVALRPDDGRAQTALGLAWKWEWLTSVEDSAYVNALRCLLSAAPRAPNDLEPRLALTGLALARGNNRLASMAARSAMVCDRDAAIAHLAYACAAYWEGNLSLAASAFREAIPRLPPESRLRFADLRAIGPAPPDPEDGAAAAAMDSTGGDSVVAAADAYWSAQDPDRTTEENEAELNFMARTATALLLFRDTDGVRWDMRAELFTRYGAPEAIAPPDPQREALFHVERHLAPRELPPPPSYLPPELDYPYHTQTWRYPSLGMSVEMWDRSLKHAYEIPYSSEPGMEPKPNPAMLAARGDLVVLGNGRGVFRGLPPGVTPMPARGSLAWFPESTGTRLVAHLEAPGGPTDSLWGRWVVIARDGHAVARGEGALAISACEPTERRVAQFSASVPPGDYHVDLSVTDGAHRRGVVRLGERVPARPESLAMSDLVLLCGARASVAGGGPVLIEPNFEHMLHAEREVSVYFELDGLTLGSDGEGAFEYAYAIRSTAKPSKRPVQPAFQASREETNIGAHRRQVVSAPIAALAPGPYELEITVRDQRSGASATRAVSFAKE